MAQEVPEENLYKLKLTDMALDASVELGHWEEALQYGQKTLPVYRYRECSHINDKFIDMYNLAPACC